VRLIKFLSVYITILFVELNYDFRCLIKKVCGSHICWC